MTELFLSLVNMSISASWIVIVVFFLRAALKKAPKWITMLLWAIVALRLICPFTFESVLSLIPSAETINPEIAINSPEINSGITIIDNMLNPIITEATITPQPEKTLNLFVFIAPFMAGVWLVGIFILLIYTVVSCLKIKKLTATAVLLRENIYRSENIQSPFVFGIIKPKIYLPLDINEKDVELVISHEKAHICRKDHIWKPLGFLILTTHWFNPIIWFGYLTFCRDIELACDEKVVKNFNCDERADYSQALLNCSANRRIISACPIAFGEVSVKNRVKSVLNYKKPTFWIIIVSIAVSVIAAVCFLTNPITNSEENISSFLEKTIIEHHRGGYKSGEFCCADFVILGKEKSKDTITVYTWVLYQEFDEFNGKIKEVSGAHIPTVITARKSDSDGKYELVEYWEPRDGTYYPTDIKEKFPWYLHIKALDSQRYIKEQKSNCLKAAEEYFEGVTENAKLKETLKQLEQTHPHFFNVPTEGGLTVYVWEMAKDIYECHLANTSQEKASGGQGYVYSIGAVKVEEMKAILTTYDIDRKDITIQPVISPWSSYVYEIDEAYTAKIKSLFWGEESVVDDTYDGSKIPKLMVTYDGATTQAIMGTTTWTYDLGNGTMQSISGDSPHPLQQLDNMMSKALKVTRHDESSLAVNLKFDVAPDSITVNAWFLGENGNTKPFDAEVDRLNIKLNKAKETCVYEVVATWNSSTKYFGTVRYSFCVVEDKNS